jgi:hypothetical protein
LLESGRWFFDTTSPWTAIVPAAPKFETYRQYFEIAVPEIARARKGPARTPCVVVARVTARPAQGRSTPGGPKDRAKGLMDALHDDRTNGPKYRDLGARAPLPDDHGESVHGLAVEVHAGMPDSVEYRLGRVLQIVGRLLMDPIDVCVPAPNDIDESARLVTPRRAYVADLVARCDRRGAEGCVQHARALVVRHRPQRDEDNTWATWISALTGGSAWSKEAWGSSPSPFSGWWPRAIASVADSSLPCEVRYEVYG